MLPQHSQKITFFGFCVAFLFVTYIQIQWIRSARDVKMREIHIELQSTLDQSDKIINQIKKRQDNLSIEQIDEQYLKRKEVGWRMFWDSIFLERGIKGVNYDFAIKIQASLTNEPTLFAFKSSEYDKNLQSGKYTSVQKILFSDFKEDVFSYDNKQNTFQVILIYDIQKPTILRGIWKILLGVLLTTIIFIFSMVAFFINYKKQKRLDKMKLDFLNGMTHELNTPITVIQLATEFLKKKQTVVDEFFDSTTEVILQETRRMSGIVKSILATARLQQQKFVLQFEEIPLDEMIEDVLKVYKFHLASIDHQIIQKNIKHDMVIHGDKFHLHHAFSNLIDNAIKYRERSRKLVIHISATQQNDRLLITIQDNGAGMNEEEQKLAFNRFFRGKESTKNIAKGFGFGLSYVQEVIELHKGSAEISSQLGLGTRVHVGLPIPSVHQ